MDKNKPKFDRVSMMINTQTGHVYEHLNFKLKGEVIFFELSEIEKKLFASRAGIVKFDGRMYKKKIDYADIYSKKDIIRTLTYILKR